MVRFSRREGASELCDLGGCCQSFVSEMECSCKYNVKSNSQFSSLSNRNVRVTVPSKVIEVGSRTSRKNQPTSDPAQSNISKMEPERLKELKEMWLDDPPKHNSTIHLAPYDANWPSIFATESKRIKSALGPNAILVKHVGSTSVPGLDAKPVIDIVLAVEDSDDEDAYVPQLEGIGYKLKIRDPNWNKHRFLNRVDPPDAFPVNLHVFSAGCEEITRMILFRDYLKAHPEDRELYLSTKRKLAAQTWEYIQGYADAKGDVVKEIMERAKKASGDEYEAVTTEELPADLLSKGKSTN